ncbi:DUF6458 family protein [Propionibacteriaceae bacterium Y1923]|uniref:DUF6458 family protein n=1 Tax=Aestuariimicrobium sp. Y1814 TaxID=3418742 RepID=UPI003C254D38
MWIGMGVVLIVIGAVLNWALQVDVPGVTDGILGWILIVAGVAAIIFSFIAQAQRNRVHSTHETRHISTGE